MVSFFVAWLWVSSSIKSLFHITTPLTCVRKMQSTTRKRKRQSENATLAALDLPDIPGVPMDVLPAFAQAIRVATKFYAKCHGQPYYGEDRSSLGTARSERVIQESSSPSRSHPPVILDALMDRMGAVSEPASSNQDRDELSLCRQSMDDAVGRWLESVKRFAKNDERRKEARATDESNDDVPSPKKNHRISVPLACFLYIWDLQQTHERIAVRRAGLYLAGLLLKRSKDCRFHLEQDDTLSQWLHATIFSYRPKKFAEDLPILQLEAHFWLSFLVDKGYSKIYPKIQVALQRLRQQCPYLEVTTGLSSGNDVTRSTTFCSMADWRRIRDISLEHGEKEIMRIDKLLGRAYECMDILVPRLGVEDSTSLDPPATANAKGGGHDDHDKVDADEDEIDWEDGGLEEFDDGTCNIPLSDFEHFSAVERTLAAMEMAGGLQAGKIEIDFRGNSQRKVEDDLDIARSDAVEAEVRQMTLAKFTKIVSLLARRHMPRLTIWLQALSNADNLASKNRALISLSSGVSKKRSRLFEQLTVRRNRASDILTSAGKLEISSAVESTDGSAATDNLQLDDAPLILRLSSSSSTNNNGRKDLMSTIQRRRIPKTRSSRSNKIQIKFHSR